MFFRNSSSDSPTGGSIVQVPAKINLALEVLGRREDGFHEVETLLVPVRLFDTLRLRPSAEPLSLTIRGSVPHTAALPTDGHNLIIQAAERLAALSGRPATGRIDLWKRIPCQAGLGGGSSDAAATLVAANRAWGLGYSRSRLAMIAADVGTDVPFFVHGGAAIGSGRGEQIEPTPLPVGIPLVLVQPPVGLSTPKVFDALRLERGQLLATSSGRCRDLVAALRAGPPAAAWKPLVRNSLQGAAGQLTDWIGRVSRLMDRLPVVAHQMTGSGSGYFAICRSWRDAKRLAAWLRGQIWQKGLSFQGAVATRTCR